VSETSKAIHDLTELIGHYHIQEVKLSTKDCDYYLTHLLAIVAERDEARRSACTFKARYMDSRIGFSPMTDDEANTEARKIASRMGWDCFKEAKP
jgi:hypothetical protein